DGDEGGEPTGGCELVDDLPQREPAGEGREHSSLGRAVGGRTIGQQLIGQGGEGHHPRRENSGLSVTRQQATGELCDCFATKAEGVNTILDAVSAATDPTRVRVFQTDGRFYLFSTLRPLPPPDGALTLVTINEDLLSAIVFVIVAAGGIFLLRYAGRIRILAVGAFLTMLVLLGVFLPTFSRQVIGPVLLLAILTVTLVWLVQYLVWVRPRDPNVIARSEARQEVRMARIRAKLAFAPAASVAQPLPQSASTPVNDKPANHAGESADDERSDPTLEEGGEKNE
ncbi:MAG: hypothetical protein IIC02_13685, partial [Planctomycetes bacterium]|nr:hypothetical protein [Planctomycetota bacterium]